MAGFPGATARHAAVSAAPTPRRRAPASTATPLTTTPPVVLDGQCRAHRLTVEPAEEQVQAWHALRAGWVELAGPARR